MFRCFLQGDYERVRDRLFISGDLHGLTVPLGQTEDWPEDSDRNKSYGDDIDLGRRGGGGPRIGQCIRQKEDSVSAAGSEIDGLNWLRRESMAKPAEKGDINLNHVFTDNGRDLNRLFPDLSLKRFLKEIEENKEEVRTFLKALEVDDEGDE